jgi:ABC-2 type transport system permease protein
MSALVEHVRFELRSMIRHPSQLLLSYLFPLGFFLFMGAVMPRLDPSATARLVPAFSLFAILTGGVLGLPTPLVELRQKGAARAFRVLGVPDGATVGVPAAANAVHGLVAAAAVALAGPALFNAEAPVHPAAHLFVLILAAFVFTGLGTLIGVVSSDARTSVLWSQSLFLPSMLLGGLMMPVAALPEGLRRFSELLPTTHLMRLLDVLAFDRAPATGLWLDVLALLATGVLAHAAALRLHAAEERGASGWRGLWVFAALVPLAATMLRS